MLDQITPIVPDGMLKDKVIIVTGASQGIGEAASFGFARAGAKVVLVARRKAIVEEHAKAIRAGGGVAYAIGADVADENSVKAMVNETMAEFGRLDGAFNNAGVEQTPAKLADTTIEDFDYTMAVKGRGTFLCMKYQVPAMEKGGGGAIVNNGSVVSERTIDVYPAPAASQGVVPPLTKVAAAAYGGSNVRVNMVVTGLIMTPERLADPLPPDRLEQIKGYCPLGRAGTGEEVAQVAAWLLSDWCSYVSGACIPVDGGHLAGRAS